MKYCEDCKWYKKTISYDYVYVASEQYLCTHPISRAREIDYVHRNNKIYPRCQDERKSDDVLCCNPDGKFWEAA